MSFPEPGAFRLVVAGPAATGEPDFLDVGPPAEIHLPGVAKGAFYWSVEGGHSANNIGQVPAQVQLAGPDGSTFGISSFPARSAGNEVDASQLDSSMAATGEDDNLNMHVSSTVDYEVIISGKVDLELPGGRSRTLTVGDLLVMGGVPHAWKNPYDEDCVYAVVTVGYNSTPSTEGSPS